MFIRIKIKSKRLYMQDKKTRFWFYDTSNYCVKVTQNIGHIWNIQILHEMYITKET